MTKLSAADLSPPEKLATGIDGFDHISMGGLPKGRATVVAGSSGAGKTIFMVELLVRGALQFGRNAVYVSLEERPEDLARNVKRFGWHLDRLVDDGRLWIINASPDSEAIEQVGQFELDGLLVQIRHAMKTINADTVFIDSIDALFNRFDANALLRREIYRIVDQLKLAGATSVLTIERVAEYGMISRHGIEEFVSDNVVILRNVLHEEKVRRTIQILKMRGDMHYKGEYPFTISHGGVSILPLAARELKQSSTNIRVGFGNGDLDRMAGGGLFRDSIILVSGPTGCGKTLMASTFAAQGCRDGERVLYLAYEESPQQLLRNAESWSLEFSRWQQDGTLRVICSYPEAMGLEDHLLVIQREIETFKPSRLIVDSVSAMERVGSVRYFREFVVGLCSYAKQQEVCSLFTSTTPRLSGGDSITEAHISTITDSIILLRYVEIEGHIRRGIAVMKMRGSQHAKQVYEFTIDNKGLHIARPFQHVQNIVLGVPSLVHRPDGEPDTAAIDDLFAL